MPSHPLERLKHDDVVLDAIPDDVATSVKQRDDWLRSLRRDAERGLEFLVSDVHRWNPGQKVRVAFLDGDTALHADIADATKEITEACNLVLDFGLDPATGNYRRWSENDTEYAAEIRVSFDKDGYFSLVGTDSANPSIGFGNIGGGPNQCSLNLGGFAASRPESWKGTARHEFLHALAFHHSHQNMRGPCQEAFRFEDDAGYIKTKDSRGAFMADSAGRRPGIYTYLSGFPNFWNKAKVDFNLKSEMDDPDLVAGPFDRNSVMLYRFPAHFYSDPNSTCLPAGDGESLSEGDRRGLRLLYPHPAPQVEALAARRHEALVAVERAAVQVESVRSDTAGTNYATQVLRTLRRQLG